MPALDDALLTEFLDLLFAEFCTRRASELVDIDRLLPSLDTAMTTERITRFQDRFIKPIRLRLLERAGKSTLPLSVWLPEAVTKKIADMLGEPAPLPRKMVENAVATEQVRDNVRAMLQETLSNFISGSKTSESSGSRSGMGAVLGWGARVAGAAGRGILGGLSTELQKQLQDRVRDFVDGAVTQAQARLVEKATSADTARSIGQGRKRGFLSLLKRTEADAAKTIARGPHARIDEMVPAIIVHNVARKELRDVIVDETRAALEELSKQTVGEALDELGLRDEAHAALRKHGLPLARSLVASEAFAQWWTRANAS